MKSKQANVEERAKSIVQETIAGKYDPLLAAREMVKLKMELACGSQEAWDDLVGIASEVDGLPLGDERSFWNKGALEEKDREADEYREQVRSIVCDALRNLNFS